MKLSNYTIIFFIAIFAYYCIATSNAETLSTMSLKYVQYNDAMNDAVDTAVSSIVENANSATELSSNFEGCVNNFYQNLYASFGAIDNEILQQDLQIYTPVLAVADVDGFYILYNDTSADGKLVKKKTMKLPYTKTFDKGTDGSVLHYTVNFTIGEDITVIMRNDDTIYKGSYSELKTKFPDTILAQKYDKTILAKPGTFTDWRNQVISQSICEQMNYYVRRNNKIAADFGITYNFSLPATAATELSNGISNVTFIALFQGYPYGAGLSDVYNKFCVSGAHVSKVHVYYVRPVQEADGLHYYYHKPECRELFDASVDADGFYGTDSGLGYAFSSAQDAASSGALPCPYCCY